MFLFFKIYTVMITRVMIIEHNNTNYDKNYDDDNKNTNAREGWRINRRGRQEWLQEQQWGTHFHIYM